MSRPREIIDVSHARPMGSMVPFVERPDEAAAAPDWIGYRASLARAYRRLDAGDTVVRCGGCSTEADVDRPVHSPRCTGDAPAPEASPAARGEEASAPGREASEAGADPVVETLLLLQAAARELADQGATNEAIARHFHNVCAAALAHREASR